MPLSMDVGPSLGNCVRWGPSPLPKKGAEPQLSAMSTVAPTQFLAHVYCGQTAGWIKMQIGTEVNLGPGEVVLDGVAVPSP